MSGIAVFADEKVEHPKRPVGRPRVWTRVHILNTIRLRGSSYKGAPGGLRCAAERMFGSWADACLAAGIEPPKRGRPRKS